MNEDKCPCGSDLQGVDEQASGMCDHCSIYLEQEYGVKPEDCVEVPFDDPREIDDWNLHF